MSTTSQTERKLNDKLCACGCGRRIKPKRWHRWTAPRFISGHHVRLGHLRGKTYNRYIPRPEEVPSGLCECGCGARTSIAKYTHRRRRYFKGHPVPCVFTHAPSRRGSASHKWRGGRFTHQTGYIYLKMPDHPRANALGYILEHRLVMEQRLGRALLPTERVHHINGVRDDNRPENLELTNGYHGPGVALKCADCGSHNVVPCELYPSAMRWIRHRAATRYRES